MNISIFKYLKKKSFFLKKANGYLAAILLLGLMAGFFLRHPLLSYGIHKAKDKLQSLTGDTVTVEQYGYAGLNRIVIKNIKVYSPQTHDSLFRASFIAVRVKIFPLFAGKVRFSEIQVKGADLHLKKTKEDKQGNSLLPGRKNFSSLIRKQTEYDVASMCRKIIGNMLGRMPSSVRLSNCRLRLSAEDRETVFFLSALTLHHEQLQGRAEIFDQGPAPTTMIEITGRLEPHRKMTIGLIAHGKKEIILPLSEGTTSVSFQFDSAMFSLCYAGRKKDSLRYQFLLKGSHAGFFHPALSSEALRVQTCSIFASVCFAPDFIQLDSSSLIDVNGIALHLYARKQGTRVKKITLEELLKTGTAEIIILPSVWDASTFFTNLPEGLFSYVRTVKASGRLRYCMRFFLDASRIDSLQFVSSLKAEKFSVLSWGALGAIRLDSSFRYETVNPQNDSLISFWVGPENPDFVPLEKISPYLIYSVMTSEDGSFMYHKGFNEESFRKALADNIKHWRFVRGGSTITMQLVKNLYLSRRKVIARKIQESLIVWLLENSRLYSKERMLEVYLNIIEWGPGIYGIGQAARFYFNKKPHELTLPESIFLAAIIPKPLYYYSFFQENGVMKPFYKDYAALIKSFMLRRNQITPHDTVHFPEAVTLAYPAAAALNKTTDSLFVPDSLFIFDKNILLFE